MPSRRAPLLIAAGGFVLALALFGQLTESVRENGTLVRLDRHVLDVVVTHRHAWLTTGARAVTVLGSIAVVAAVAAAAMVALLVGRRPRHALFLAASITGTAVLVAFVKRVVDRPRPPIADRLVASAGDSFPSGHAAQSIACYVALAFVASTIVSSARARGAIWAVAAVIAVSIGFTRVYLGVHWLGDVVSGWLLGAGLLLALVGVWYALPAGRRRVTRR